MSDPQDPEDLDAAARERLGERTPALAEDVLALNPPPLDAITRALMLKVGRVIEWNLDIS